MSRPISDRMIRAARDRHQKENQTSKSRPGLTRLHLLIHPGNEHGNVAIDILDRGIGEVDVLQVKMQQEAMIIRDATVECLSRLSGRSLDPPIRQRRSRPQSAPGASLARSCRQYSFTRRRAHLPFPRQRTGLARPEGRPVGDKTHRYLDKS
jgi:hypothetical protein